MNQPAAPAGQPPQQELNLRILLQEMITRGASDLHITVGNPAKIRIDGSLTDSNTKQVLAPKDTLSLAYSILTDNQKKRFETDDELDFSFGVQNLSRFRGNVYKQRGCVAMAIRQIPYEIIPTEKLGLPPIVNQLAERPRGLVLVTGPTFEKFERLGRTGDGGSGLGLYISRRIARAMGGDLNVKSAPGEGARFILDLPTAEAAK